MPLHGWLEWNSITLYSIDNSRKSDQGRSHEKQGKRQRARQVLGEFGQNLLVKFEENIWINLSHKQVSFVYSIIMVHLLFEYFSNSTFSIRL